MCAHATIPNTVSTISAYRSLHEKDQGYIDKPGFRFTPRHISGKDKQEHRQDQVPEIAAVLALGENIEVSMPLKPPCVGNVRVG